MNEWPLLSGPLPLVLVGAGTGALLLLLSRRDRRWWFRTVPAVAVTTVVALAAVVVAALGLSPFPDPPPAILWWSVGAGLFGLGLAVARSIGAPWWRRGLALAAALVVVAAATNQVNQHFGQFPTVGAALGAPVANQIDLAQVASKASETVTRPPRGTVAQVWRPPPGLPAAGTVSQVVIPAPVSGFAARPAWVYLPPAYLASPRAQLPVLVLLAGQPGSPRDWLVGGQLQSMMDRYASAHGGLAPVVVIPDWSGSLLGNPMCLDSRLGHAQTYLSVDVPAWVRATLQVDPAPAGWAIAGSSAGGTCALQLALNAPRVYPTFIDISGQSEPTLGDRTRTVAAAFGGNTLAYTAVAPMDLLTHRRYPDSAGYVVVGGGDATYRPQATRVALAARRAGIHLVYRELPGGHDWRVWGPGLETALPWLATRLHLSP